MRWSITAAHRLASSMPPVPPRDLLNACRSSSWLAEVFIVYIRSAFLISLLDPVHCKSIPNQILLTLDFAIIVSMMTIIKHRHDLDIEAVRKEFPG